MIVAAETFQRAAGMLAIAEQRMLKNYPFHARFIARWRCQATTLVDTMAVTVRDGDILLMYNPVFVIACDFAELAGVLHHEVIHLLFGHVFLDPEEFADQEALTIAEEVTANEFVREPLPGHPILLADYPSLPPHEDTLTRYKRLERPQSEPGMDEKLPLVYPNSSLDVPKNAALVPNSAPAEPLLNQSATLDDHSIWTEARATGPMGELVVRVTITRAAAALSPEDWQDVPEALQRLIAGIRAGTSETRLTPGQGTLDWRALLRRYVREATTLRPVFNRPPRRFPDLIGIIPGHSRTATRAAVMAVIDTSASITRPLLNLIAGELHRMARSHEVTVVECDAAVHRIYRYQGELHSVHGRGGTDLRPPFAAGVLDTLKPDVVVYFTDGYGPAPTQAPSVPVVWCLTREGNRPALWGRVVWMS
jgi:predicted metal-dependent peptidase